MIAPLSLKGLQTKVSKLIRRCLQILCYCAYTCNVWAAGVSERVIVDVFVALICNVVVCVVPAEEFDRLLLAVKT